jgi:peptide/nickel transport system substrate-binding protein
MNLKSTPVAAAVFVALACLGTTAGAVTLKIGNQGDALSMDPHSLNESLQLTVLENVFETLVYRGPDYKLTSGLATSWKQTSPTVWHFDLRKNVQFHDGTPFTADDVIFSYERAKSDGSDMKSYVGQIKEIKKINDHSIDVVTNAPFPILPELFYRWFIMSKKWCESNQATRPVDRRKGIENAASFRANGTGPYRVRERQPNVRTTFVRNGNYWGKVQGNVDEVIFNVIGNDATRVAALLSGDGAGSGAGRGPHQGRAQPQGAAGSRTARDLPGHGPEARRAAVLQRQGQEPVQGQARAPGVLPGDRHRGHQAQRDARRRHADRRDVPGAGQGFRPRPQQAAAV